MVCNNTILQLKQRAPSGNADSKAREGETEMCLQHATMQEIKEMLEDNGRGWSHTKGHRNQQERAPSGQS